MDGVNPNNNNLIHKDNLDPVLDGKKPVDQKKNEQSFDAVQIIAIGVLGIAALTALTVVAWEITCLVKEILEEKFFYKMNSDELMGRVSEKLPNSLIEQINKIEGINHARFFRRILKSESLEVEILRDLHTMHNIKDEDLAEVLKGGHFCIKDGGQMFKQWEDAIAKSSQFEDLTEDKKKKKHARMSSHRSDPGFSQYGVQGPAMRELIFSRITKDDAIYTWIQAESHPTSLGHIIRHMKSYMAYKITNMNQGPYGDSNATESKPIVLEPKAH